MFFLHLYKKKNIYLLLVLVGVGTGQAWFLKGLFTLSLCWPIYFLLILESTEINTKTLDPSPLLSYCHCYHTQKACDPKKEDWLSLRRCLPNPKKCLSIQKKGVWRLSGNFFGILNKIPSIKLYIKIRCCYFMTEASCITYSENSTSWYPQVSVRYVFSCPEQL